MNVSEYNLSADEILEKIFHYMEQLFEEKELSSVLKLLTGLGQTLVCADRASFWFRDIRKHQIWTLAAVGIEKIVLPEHMGIVGHSIMNNEVLIINDPYNDPRFNPEVDKKTGYVTKSILTLPVTNTAGEVIGAYQAVNKLAGDGNFTLGDAKRLAMAAAFSGKSLESYMLYNAALEDQLTGLKNRRGFFEFYNRNIVPMLDKMTVSLIICDIDHFKRVNDTYGHNAGDEILRHVSSMLADNSRVDDGVFRWGGEEFIILLPKTDLDDAAQIAERMRQKIEQSVPTFEGTEIKVTMSFGCAEIDPSAAIESTVQRADEKLYTAKETGRNRVVK